MRFLALLLMLFPTLAHADMASVDVGAGQGTKPFYGVDYQFNKGFPYLDLSLSANQEYIQPGISAGAQFEHINVGLAAAVAFSHIANDGSFSGQLTVGPEAGYQQALTKTVYIKENNQYMGYNGVYNFSATLGLGISF